jgi:hypothetical protein
MLDAALSRIDNSYTTYRPYRTDSKQETEALQRAVQFFQIERLGEIAVAARLECGFFHTVNVVGRDRDDRRVVFFTFELAKVFDRLETVENRHVQVNNDETRTKTAREIESLPTVFSLENTVTFQFKGPLEHNASVDRVFGNEYSRIKYCRHSFRSGAVTKVLQNCVQGESCSEGNDFAGLVTYNTQLPAVSPCVHKLTPCD